MTRESAADRGATPVLVVASWYPNVVDPAAGRFVADQVVGLAATGRVAPSVVSFDPIRLVGGASARTRQAPIVEATFASAIEAEPRLFVPGIGVVPAVDVARLGIAEGSIPSLGTTAAVDYREAALRPLAERLAREGSTRPALVHAHTGFPDGAAAAALAEDLGCPLVITEHATFLERILAEPGQRGRYAAAASRAARIIAVSTVLADQLRSALPEIEDRLVVIPNVVAIDDFRPLPLAERRQDELLFVGYRKEIKGIDTLLEAFARIHARRPAARLRLVGGNADPELEARWRGEARRLGVEPAVAFEDGAPREEIAAAMARASVFVHASRYETFGVVAAEALAAGTPVVATASGGVSEILGEDASRLGAIVPVGDAAAFAAAVLDVLDRRASLEPARLRAAADRFGPAVVAGRLADLYDEVLSESAAPNSRPPRSAQIEPGGAPAHEWADLPTVVIALDRRAAAAVLTKLPDGFRSTIALVTSTRPTDVALPATGRLAEVRAPVPADPGAEVPDESRLRRLLSHPIATLRDRRDRDALLESGIARATDAVRAALRETPFGDAARSPRLVALDGRDVEVAARLASDRGIGMIGGIRRLADEWAASSADDGQA